jgi:hypothetical protein
VVLDDREHVCRAARAQPECVVCICVSPYSGPDGDPHGGGGALEGEILVEACAEERGGCCDDGLGAGNANGGAAAAQRRPQRWARRGRWRAPGK